MTKTKPQLKKLHNRSQIITIPIVHHEQLQLWDIVYHKLLEAVWQIVSSLLVRTVTNIGHQGASFELPPDPRINTLGPSPTRLTSHSLNASKPQLESLHIMLYHKYFNLILITRRWQSFSSPDKSTWRITLNCHTITNIINGLIESTVWTMHGINSHDLDMC